jgi:hypothetical protein
MYAVAAFILATIGGLWAWNTISELFSLPHAQYKHIIAAGLLLLIFRWSLTTSHKNCRHGEREHNV